MRLSIYTALVLAVLAGSVTSYATKKSSGKCKESWVTGQCYKDYTFTDFESFSLANVKGQGGWKNDGLFDFTVVNTSVKGFGKKALLIKDTKSSGSFDDQTYAKPLQSSVGEKTSTLARPASDSRPPFTETHRYKHFEAQFDFKAASGATPVIGEHFSVSADRGDGSRMTYIRFTRAPDGIKLIANDVQGILPGDDAACGDGPDVCANFVDRILMTLNPAKKYKIGITLYTKEGEDNDVFKVYVDGKVVFTGNSWEQYYRHDPESVALQQVRVTKTLLFRISNEHHAHANAVGFLIDNVLIGAY